MSWQEISSIVAGVIFSVGGAGAIIAAISKWFGGIIADSIIRKKQASFDKELENLKSEHDLELEKYKSQLLVELETIKAMNLRVSEISKTQYDTELVYLKELTRSSYILMIECFSVIPVEKMIMANPSAMSNRYTNHFQKYADSINDAMQCLGSALAFIDDEIEQKYDYFLTLCQEQYRDFVAVYISGARLSSNAIDRLYERGERIEDAYREAMYSLRNYFSVMKNSTVKVKKEQNNGQA